MKTSQLHESTQTFNKLTQLIISSSKFRMENSKLNEAANANNSSGQKKDDAEETPNPYGLTKKEQCLVGVGLFVLTTVIAIAIGNYLNTEK